MLERFDSLIENDAAAALGGAFVCILGWTVVSLGWAPADAVGPLASAAGLFSVAAFRRAGNEKRRAITQTKSS